MIRSFLKDKARKAAIKLLNMEYDTVDRDPEARGKADPSKFDPDKIPKLVDGDGDTPGPNHKEDIGRTFTSAQLTGGKGIAVVDIRTPLELVGGILPTAMLLPRDLVKKHLDLLPKDRNSRVVIYDQLGGEEAIELAAWLRENGWPWARRLKGGYAEWIEHSEAIVTPNAPEGAKKRIGDPVRLEDGREGWVLSVQKDEDALVYRVWLDTGEVIGPLAEDALGS
jgi:rhodanese-related sulfurtransferase